MKRILPLVAVILFLGCLALGLLALHERGKVRRLDAKWRVVLQGAEKRIIDLDNQVAKDKATEAAAYKKIADLMAAGSAPKGAGANAGKKVVHISDLLKDHPELLAFYTKQMRRNVERMYGDGLSTLKLPPDRLSQLENLLAAGQMGSISAQQAAEAAGLKRGSPEWQKAMKKAGEDLRQQIIAIMGPNAEITLGQLQLRARIQSVVQYNYAPDFAEAGIPLDATQSSGLVDAIAEANLAEKDPANRSTNYNEPDPATGLSPHDSQMIANASRVLTPAQLQVLTNDRAQNGRLAVVMKQYNSAGGAPMSLAP